MTDRDWREDPGWKLADYDEAYWRNRGGPPPKPTEAAELAQPDRWASLYDGRVAVATWWRSSP